ncbi:hypothetical protein BDV93DRAFT_549088 [Ceratobasidium sp. AG-I]|nr:hypothetical protein BDV93DRAFT_549088 [Ceratobasidium sp. AG-I]
MFNAPRTPIRDPFEAPQPSDSPSWRRTLSVLDSPSPADPQLPSDAPREPHSPLTEGSALVPIQSLPKTAFSPTSQLVEKEELALDTSTKDSGLVLARVVALAEQTSSTQLKDQVVSSVMQTEDAEIRTNIGSPLIRLEADRQEMTGAHQGRFKYLRDFGSSNLAYTQNEPSLKSTKQKQASTMSLVSKTQLQEQPEGVSGIGGGNSKAVENNEGRRLVASNSMPTFEITSETPLEAVICYFRSNSGLRDYTTDLECADCSRYPLATGGLADVYRARLKDGVTVAIKRLRNNFVSEGKATKRTARELHTWSKLHHENVPGILGPAVFGDKLAMIPPWMGKGNIMQYVASKPDLDRYALEAQVVEAVFYLHNIDVDNILVSDDGILKLTDFGLTMMHDQIIRFSTTDASGGTYRWMAPELIQGEGVRSKKTDIYALAMRLVMLKPLYKIHVLPSHTGKWNGFDLKDVEAGLSQREASERRGVPKTTLWGRIHGRQSWKDAHKHEQVLTPAQEDELIAWACAEAILREKYGPDANIILGEHWDERFCKRHPEVKVTTSKAIDEKRVMAKNPAYVMDFYVKLSNVYDHYNIPVANRFNCDEKGFQLGVTGRERVLIMKRDPDAPRDGYAGGSKQPIECICADGTVLPPFIIMKGKYVQKRWSENSPLPATTRWACSPNGWTDNELGVEYIKAFDEWTADKRVYATSRAGGKWRCLVLDGHGSHVTYEFLKYAIEAQIMVIGLPSHTTDFLQPLDRVLFRPLQRAYSKEVGRRMQNNQAVTKDLFGTVFHHAREETYTYKNIKSAFDATGISPLNPWRSDLMLGFREKLQTEGSPSKSTASSSIQRQQAKNRYDELINNPGSTANELRAALSEAVSVINGAEARSAILSSELASTRAVVRERRGQSARRGRVGKARVYTQEAIEELRDKQSEAEELRGKGRGQGRGRGRGCGRGRGQKVNVVTSKDSSSQSPTLSQSSGA